MAGVVGAAVFARGVSVSVSFIFSGCRTDAPLAFTDVVACAPSREDKDWSEQGEGDAT